MSHVSAESIRLNANEALLRSRHFLLASTDESGRLHFQIDVAGMSKSDFRVMLCTVVNSMTELLVGDS